MSLDGTLKKNSFCVHGLLRMPTGMKWISRTDMVTDDIFFIVSINDIYYESVKLFIYSFIFNWHSVQGVFFVYISNVICIKRLACK